MGKVVAMEQREFISIEEWEHLSEEKRQLVVDAVRKDANTQTDHEYELVQVKNSFYLKFGKRFFDIVLGGAACIIALPINLLLAVVTFFDVGSPVFFKQERVGKDRKRFNLLKFRNMTNETNEAGVLLPPDQRVTKWGKFVRKTSMDELLNFWNILKGDMSLIGPRPLPVKYEARYSEYQQQRHMVKPGLECPYHDSALAKNGWQGRFENDVWYVKNVSFGKDVKMFFLLVKKVFSKEERKESAEGRTGEFIGCYPDGTAMDEFAIPRKYLDAVRNNEREGE